MVKVPTPEFQNLWSNQIEFLGLECRDTIQQHPDDFEAVMECVRGVLIAIARLREQRR
jgi:hypothetical protein